MTVERFKKLMPFIKVVKLPRCRSSISFALSTFVDAFLNGTSYNIVDFIGAGYQMYLVRDVGRIPSHLFDETFFNTVEKCRMDCKERRCTLCFDKMRQIKQLSYKQKRLARRAEKKIPDRTWFVDKNWRNEKTIL